MHLVQVYEPDFQRYSPNTAIVQLQKTPISIKDMLLDEQAHKNIPMNLTLGVWPWAEDALCSHDHCICKDHP